MHRDLVIGRDVPQLGPVVQAVDRDRRAVPDEPDRPGRGPSGRGDGGQPGDDVTGQVTFDPLGQLEWHAAYLLLRTAREWRMGSWMVQG